jgi:RNA-directed DNA polymerase
MKPPKETRRVKGRGRPEERLGESREDRTQSRTTLPIPLTRVHEAASRDRKTQFTALLHHVNVDALRRAFGRLKRGAAAGVDGVTVATY